MCNEKDISVKAADWDFWLVSSVLYKRELAYILANLEPSVEVFDAREKDPQVVRKYLNLIEKEMIAETWGLCYNDKIEMQAIIRWLVEKDYRFSIPDEIWERIKQKYIPEQE